MAMSTLMLRNLSKLNCANLLKSARMTPLNSYKIVAGAHPNMQQIQTRSFSLTAPKMSAAGGSHTAIWTLERALSASMLVVLPAAFVFPSQAMDALMAASLVLHSHWGIEAMVTDYLRPNIVGPVVPKVAHGALLLISITTLAGLFYLIHNDSGIAESVKKLWTVKCAN